MKKKKKIIILHQTNLPTRVCLAAHNFAKTSLISIRSIGDSIEHATPILMTVTKHSSTLALLRPSLQANSSEGSTVSITFSGKAILQNSWRVKPPWNMQFVGRLLVNISSNITPKLYTSPVTEASLPMPYSKHGRFNILAMLYDQCWHLVNE